MKISCESIRKICTESEIWNQYLNLKNAVILELGCGKAELTRQIATTALGCRITAMEVDEIQHAKNLQVSDLFNINFMAGCAENIPAEGDIFDVVMMFKSLHHVPLASMDIAFNEIHRVLKSGGKAYISEPIFAGDFNDILRLFHDEEKVREAAFEAVKRSVNDGKFKLVDEVFFLAPMRFDNFSEFEQKIIGVSHSEHHLSNAVYQQVKQDFMKKMRDDGAHFLMPMRVDILAARK
ncbi:MAG: class I SAM-dependent methyltransferase [Mariprofundaceae bacterium]|nr:class I SAM-dependent methyltransferase [Mariprofundaceae bacterium]